MVSFEEEIIELRLIVVSTVISPVLVSKGELLGWIGVQWWFHLHWLIKESYLGLGRSSMVVSPER